VDTSLIAAGILLHVAVLYVERPYVHVQAIADEIFEAYLDLLPPALAGALLKRQQRLPNVATDGYAGLPPLRSGRDQLAEVRATAHNVVASACNGAKMPLLGAPLAQQVLYSYIGNATIHVDQFHVSQ
jgi:hypothetical protein